MIKKKDFNINNVDGVIIIQEPKLKQFIPQIRKNLSDISEISIDQVSVKATTVDHVGAIGNGDGWAAQAIATISK